MKLPYITFYVKEQYQNILRELSSVTHVSASRLVRAALEFAYQHADEFVKFVLQGGGQ